MKTFNEQHLLPDPERLRQLNKELRWMRFWNWVGWPRLMAAGQLVVLWGLFLWGGPLIRWFDPTAGVIDAGTLSAVMLSMLIVDSCALSAWGIVRLIREGLTGFYQWDNEQADVINKLPVCLAAKIVSGIFFGLVLLSVGLFWALV